MLPIRPASAAAKTPSQRLSRSQRASQKKAMDRLRIPEEKKQEEERRATLKRQIDDSRANMELQLHNAKLWTDIDMDVFLCVPIRQVPSKRSTLMGLPAEARDIILDYCVPAEFWVAESNVIKNAQFDIELVSPHLRADYLDRRDFALKRNVFKFDDDKVLAVVLQKAPTAILSKIKNLNLSLSTEGHLRFWGVRVRPEDPIMPSTPAFLLQKLQSLEHLETRHVRVTANEEIPDFMRGCHDMVTRWIIETSLPFTKNLRTFVVGGEVRKLTIDRFEIKRTLRKEAYRVPRRSIETVEVDRFDLDFDNLHHRVCFQDAAELISRF